jgi:hypothetical protein
MLEEMATVGDESVISWQPHGKAFRVHHPDAFAKTVMPRYFKQQTKYKSFQRQLHMYGFHRINKGMDTGAYFHSMFIRNKKSMSLHMSCKKIKGKKNSRKAVDQHAMCDPDFFSLDSDVDNTTSKKNKWGCGKRRTATVSTCGDSDHHADEEKLLRNRGALL